jgi:hypothetical protein
VVLYGGIIVEQAYKLSDDAARDAGNGLGVPDAAGYLTNKYDF